MSVISKSNRLLRIAELIGADFPSGVPLHRPDAVDGTVGSWSGKLVKATRLLPYCIRKRVSDVIINNLLYGVHDEELQLDKFRFQRGCLPLEFATPQQSVNKPIYIAQQRPAQYK